MYFTGGLDAINNFVGDMGNGFNIFTFVSKSAFAIDDGLVDLTGGDVVGTREVGIEEAFVVAEVLVGFKAVMGDKDFAVFLGTNSTGIDV